MPHEVIMPALGMAQDSGVIVAWRKALGDAVAVGDPLFDVETDKTTMEVEAAHEGFLTEIRADAGADIPIGQTIAIIATSSDARLDVASDTTTESAPKPSTPSPAPTAPIPPTLQNEPAAPSTPSAVPILASPKAKFEAHRRGIDLRRLVDQGVPQPFHVADLDRLKPETGAAGSPPAASQLSARFEWQAFNDFIAWAEEKTGRQGMRQPTLAAFAAAAFRAVGRSGDAGSLMVLAISLKGKGKEIFLRDPDLQGLGSLADGIADSSGVSADLAVIDLNGTRLTAYHPPARPEALTIMLGYDAENSAVATLHFCESDLPLLAAARFLDSFAARVTEPAAQLL